MLKRFFLSILLLIAFLVLLVLALQIHYRSQDNSVVSNILTHYAKQDFQWQCTPLQHKRLTASGSVQWTQLACKGHIPYLYPLEKTKPTGNIKVNIINADLSDKHIKLTPVVATKGTNPNHPRQLYVETLDTMAKANPKFIAGINGGYFFVNRAHHKDYTCPDKRYPQLSSSSIADGLLIIDNHHLSENCSAGFWGSPGRSTLLQTQHGNWFISRIKAKQTPNDFLNALGAGPGLIQSRQGKPHVMIRWEGIPSTFEFSANTAVALAKDSKAHEHVIFITVDGEDKKRGMSASEMANFIYDVIPKQLQLHLISAMSMDQGHSTTMYVRDAKPQIVSQSLKHGGDREVHDALFIESI